MHMCLTRGQRGLVNDLLGLLDVVFLRGLQGSSGQGHHSGSSHLENTKGLEQVQERGNTLGLGAQLDNNVSLGDIEDLTAKLVGQLGDGVQVLVLVSQSLGDSDLVGVEVSLQLSILELVTVVGQEILEVLGAENGDSGKQKLSLDDGSVGVVQYSPDGDKVLDLSSGLLDDSVLASQHDGHSRQIVNLSVADNQRVNVEASRSKGSGNSGQHTRLVLNETVENMSLDGSLGGHGSLVENRGDSSVGVPCRSLNNRQLRLRSVSVERLVRQGGDGRVSHSLGRQSRSHQSFSKHCVVVQTGVVRSWGESKVKRRWELES